VSRLTATMALDIKIQARSKLYALGIGVALAMGLMVRFLVPTAHIGRGLAAFYVLGLGGTTYMFGASMLLLDRADGTLEALRCSMITTSDYVLSKALTLTGFALVESVIVYAIAARGVDTDFVVLFVGAVVLGVLYSLLGLALAAPHRALTTFLLPWGTFWAMVLQLPFLSLIGVGPDLLWYAIPTQAPLLILQGAFEPLEPWQWAYAVGTSLGSIGAAWWFVRRRFRAHVRLPEA
jgi:fluoroquinolone transport system permease protein